jgi:trk system potassium uptake protein TrkH
MQLFATQRILGLLLMLFSITMLPPTVLSWLDHDHIAYAFMTPFALSLTTGLSLWLPVREHRRELRVRDGFLVVALFWLVLSLFSALPFMLSPHLSLTDSLFEAISGLTTTGATVIVGIDDLPMSFLYYRMQLQWLGGLGIVVLAVAILPMLGIGGMQLYRAEIPGLMKQDKLTPRITETAKALWYIYLGLTVACALGYWFAGMTPFDAIAHSFSTVSTGGFSTHDDSLGYFNNPKIDAVADVFMLLSGMNFFLHFVAWRKLSVKIYQHDAEVRAYISVMVMVSVITSVYLYISGTFNTLGQAFNHGIFQTISIGTSTGFTTAQYHHWPTFLPALLLLISFIGGCGGSSAGGMKVIRALLLFKQGMREIKRLVHPNAQFIVKIGNKPLSDRVVEAVWGFFSLYVLCYILMSLLVAATGLDLLSSFSAVAACINNMGPGLGVVEPNYSTISGAAKWILCFAMLLGRLEIFTLLVLLTPDFWRK